MCECHHWNTLSYYLLRSNALRICERPLTRVYKRRRLAQYINKNSAQTQPTYQPLSQLQRTTETNLTQTTGAHCKQSKPVHSTWTKWAPVRVYTIVRELEFVNHTHIHPFNGPFSGTTQVSRYQKGKTNLDFTEARDSKWQWHQLGHTQVCISLQTDDHASIPPLSFFTGRMPFLPPNLQCQSTEGTVFVKWINQIKWN